MPVAVISDPPEPSLATPKVVSSGLARSRFTVSAPLVTLSTPLASVALAPAAKGRPLRSMVSAGLRLASALAKVPPLAGVAADPMTRVAAPEPKVMAPAPAPAAAFSVRVPAVRTIPPVAVTAPLMTVLSVASC